MSWVDLTNSGLLDAQFPYPLAFETCYNLAIECIDLLKLLCDLLNKFINLGWGFIFIVIIVLSMRVFFRMMK